MSPFPIDVQVIVHWFLISPHCMAFHFRSRPYGIHWNCKMIEFVWIMLVIDRGLE